MKRLLVFILTLLLGLAGGYRVVTVVCQTFPGGAVANGTLANAPHSHIDGTDAETGGGSSSEADTAADSGTGANLESAVNVQTTTRESIEASLVPRLTVSASASSEKANYPASNAVDGLESTSWQESMSGDGIGEYLELSLERPSRIYYLTLKLGNWESDEKYSLNGVPSVMTISGEGFSIPLRFNEPEIRGEYCLAFEGGLSVNTLRFTIDEVYNNGTGWQDTCIAEIEVYGE